jgi:hypothetical protein
MWNEMRQQIVDRGMGSRMATPQGKSRDSIFNKPFDMIDRLFRTENASIRGVAAWMGGLSALFWREGGATARLPASILATLAIIAFVASFFNEGAREIWVASAITAFVLFVVFF